MPRAPSRRGRPPRSVRTAVWSRTQIAPPLIKVPDQGGEATVSHEDVAATERIDWTETFMTANRDELGRLAIDANVRVKEGRAVVVLTSSDRLGAIPLRSPMTRKVA